MRSACSRRSRPRASAPAPSAFADAPSLTAALGGALATSGPEVRLLVKGSRVNRLERVVDALTGGVGAGKGGH